MVAKAKLISIVTSDTDCSAANNVVQLTTDNAA